MLNRRPRARGFTLVELIVTLLVLGVLATLAMIGYSKYTEHGQAVVAKTNLRQLATAVLVQQELSGDTEITRADVIASMADSSVTIVEGTSAAGGTWYLYGPEDEPGAVGEFAIAFDNGEGTEVSAESGTRLAMVTSGGGHSYSQVVGADKRAPDAVVEHANVVSPSKVLESETPPAEPEAPEEQQPDPLTLNYATTAFTPGATSQVLAPTTAGGSGAYSYSLDGTLPEGVVFDAATGQFTGPSAWPTQISQVSAGGAGSVALAVDGSVWSWGSNSNGQLGDGTTTGKTAPVKVTALADKTITHVSAGGSHALALASDGTVWAWGNNANGRLGDGTTTNQSTPVQVVGLSGKLITQIAAGDTYSVALASDGSVWSWGYNYSGQLGDGTTTARSAPVQVTALAGKTITQIAAYSNTVALQSDGTVWVWGSNTYGGLGDGTTTNQSTPVRVATLADKTVTQVTAGGNYSMVLASDGTLWGWGANNAGQLGNGTPLSAQKAPVQVTGLDGQTITQIDADASHTVALAADGTVWSWGNNSNRKLGDGTTTNQSTPVRAATLADKTVTQIAAGSTHSLALTSSGAVLAVGLNYNGQLGDGTGVTPTVPVSPVGMGERTGWPVTLTVTVADTAGNTFPLEVTLSAN